jgi:hypothetical protein
VKVPEISRYDELAGSFEALAWRILPKPGGATMKPADWYSLSGALRSRCPGRCSIIDLLLTPRAARSRQAAG